MRPLPRSFFERDAVTVARDLLGKIVKKGACEGIIVECEAYADDASSHAVKRPMQGRLMRETYGHWYVYFTYGMHWCANVTCDKTKTGAVLIRAVEPVAGIAQMRKRRPTPPRLRRAGRQLPVSLLCRGPACFTQAFGIGKADNGKPLASAFGIFNAPRIADAAVAAGPRIGIRHATELPWRFYVKDNPFVSKLPKIKGV